MNEQRPHHIIVAALMQRGDEILVVREQGPNDPQSAWSLPGGVVEQGESLAHALSREVREETGLHVLSLDSLIYTLHTDNPNLQQLHEGLGPGEGYLSTVFVFEASDWEGQLVVADPDDYILEAVFLPLSDAIDKLGRNPFRVMREPITAYLRGEVGQGMMWFYQRDPNGNDNLIACLPDTSLDYRLH